MPEDKTTYSTGDTPVTPHVVRPRSPVRARVFPPRQEGRVYKGYYPESRCAYIHPSDEELIPALIVLILL